MYNIARLPLDDPQRLHPNSLFMKLPLTYSHALVNLP